MKPRILNELAHALTNFSEFPGNTIVADSKFQPVEQNTAWYALREAFFLDTEEDDVYINIALSLMFAHPNVIDVYDNAKLEFGLHRPSETVKMNYGEFVTIGNRIGGISKCGVFPLPRKYTISYKHDDAIEISMDTGASFVTKARSFAYPKGGSVLAVDWPDRVPFYGPIRSFDTWSPSSKLVIDYRPVSMDYKKWLEYVEIKSDISEILIPSGFSEEYLSSQSDCEKLSIMLLALAKSNKSIKQHDGHRH